MIRYDFTARPCGAYASGFLRDENGASVPKLLLRGVKLTNGSTELAFRNSDETDGFYSFGLRSDDWVLLTDPVESAKHQLLLTALPRITIAPLAAGGVPPDHSSNDLDGFFLRARLESVAE